MSKKATRQAVVMLDKSNVSIDDVKGTGTNGLVTVGDARLHLAKVTEVLDAEIITEEVKEEKPVNSRIKFYQLGKKDGEEVETFNHIFDFKQTGEVDLKRLAKFVSNQLFKFTEVIMRRNLKTSFSPTKPMWFELQNGKEQIQLNLEVCRTWKMALKAKKGANPVSRHQMINDIEGIFEMNGTIEEATI